MGGEQLDGTVVLGIYTKFNTLNTFCENWYTNASDSEKLKFCKRCSNNDNYTDKDSLDLEKFKEILFCSDDYEPFHRIIVYMLEISNPEYNNIFEDSDEMYNTVTNKKISIVKSHVEERDIEDQEHAIVLLRGRDQKGHINANLVIETMSNKEYVQQFLELCKFITKCDVDTSDIEIISLSNWAA